MNSKIVVDNLEDIEDAIKEVRKHRGRPPLSELFDTVNLNVRVTTEHREAFHDLGGSVWLRNQLEAHIEREQLKRAKHLASLSPQTLSE